MDSAPVSLTRVASLPTIDPISIRLAQSQDLPFIFSSWLRTYKNLSSFGRKISRPVFFDWHHRIIENIFSKPTTEILVAHPKEDPEVILAYLVTEKWNDTHIIHFTFVKKEFQKMKIAKSLWIHAAINPEAAHFTHWTFDVDQLIEKFPRLTYDPYKL